ncbi:MAG: hypothetical protein WAU74_13555 [Pseudolabrys sp.]|jgi:hypothetical protein
MSRKSVARMMLGYFVAAFAFGAFTEFQKFATFDFGDPIFATTFVSKAFGGAAALYVISGIIPMIVWGFSRFRPQNAGAPLVIWAILLVIAGVLAEIALTRN